MTLFQNLESGHPRPRTSRQESGMATFMFIVLLGIMMVLATAEGRALFRLHQEVKLLERQQIQRLNGPQAKVMIENYVTNAVTTPVSQP
jgi:hypothetical protein